LRTEKSRRINELRINYRTPPKRCGGDGLCLFAKRLERGRFVWPRAEEGVAVLSRAQLSMLLEGDRLADAATDLAAATGRPSLVW